MGDHNYWGTKQELDFIYKLGSWGVVHRGGVDRSHKRLELLKKYADSLENRKIWGNIDPAEIYDYFGKEYDVW